MITSTISDFQSGYLHINSCTSLDISKWDLIWGNITLGNVGWSDFILGNRPTIWEFTRLASEMMDWVHSSSYGLLTSRSFESLVDSDLASATYRLGSVFARCVASKILGVHWLQHCRPLIRAGVVVLGSNNTQRPDYVGMDRSGQWHSIEAKGRSNPTTIDLISHAKAQAANLVSINGSAPSTNCGSVTHLDRKPIHVEFSDPKPENSDEEIIIEVDSKSFFQSYYAPFDFTFMDKQDFKTKTQKVDSNLGVRDFITVDIPNKKDDQSWVVQVGIDSGLLDLIAKLHYDPADILKITTEFKSIKPLDFGTSIGADGVMISLRNNSQD